MPADLDALGDAARTAAPPAPPLDELRRRNAARQRRGARGLAAGVAVVVLVGGGLVIARGTRQPDTTSLAAQASSQDGTGQASSEDDGEAQPEPGATTAPADVEVPPEGAPSGWEQDRVGVSDGERSVGTISVDDYEAAIDRVVARGEEVLGPDEPRNRDAADRLVAALHVLEAVPVTDEAGQVVGYWSTGFISADAYPAEVEGAQRVVDSYPR